MFCIQNKIVDRRFFENFRNNNLVEVQDSHHSSLVIVFNVKKPPHLLHYIKIPIIFFGFFTKSARHNSNSMRGKKHKYTC